MLFAGHNPNYKSIAEHCNLWRNYDDIYDSWDSVLGIINYYGEDKDGFSDFGGPGHWNDPDMLIIGNYGLSLDQVSASLKSKYISMISSSRPLHYCERSFQF